MASLKSAYSHDPQKLKVPAYNSIYRKIRKHSLKIIIAVMTVVTVIIGSGLHVIRQNVITANNILGTSAANDAKHALISQIEDTLLRLVESKAAVGDEKFASIAEHIEIISQTATNIRSNLGEEIFRILIPQTQKAVLP